MSEQLRLDLASFLVEVGLVAALAYDPAPRGPPHRDHERRRRRGFARPPFRPGRGTPTCRPPSATSTSRASASAPRPLAESRVLSVTVPDDTEENGAQGGRTTSSDSSATPA